MAVTASSVDVATALLMLVERYAALAEARRAGRNFQAVNASPPR
jgi:hypothetical protein